MQEIIILNSKTNINAYRLAKAENKPVLVVFNTRNFGMLVQTNGVITMPYKLSKIVMVNYGEGFSGSQYVLTKNNMPKERAVGYVLQ